MWKTPFAVGLVAVLGFPYFCSGEEPAAEKVGSNRPITLDIVMATIPGDDTISFESHSQADIEKLVKRIKDAEERGTAFTVTRFRSTAVEGQPAQYRSSHVLLNQGRQPELNDESKKAFPQWKRQAREYATEMQATCKVEADGQISIQVKVERALPKVFTPVVSSDGTELIQPLGIESQKVVTSVTVTNGRTLLLGGGRSKQGDVTTDSIILLTARLGEAPEVAAAEVIEEPVRLLKVFQLQHHRAADTAATQGELFDGKKLRIAPDKRTNAVIAHAVEADLQLIEALLLRLDRDPAAPVD